MAESKTDATESKAPKAKGNSVASLKAFFSTADKPVSSKEMMDFWKSCSTADKAEFQAAVLS